MTGLKIPEKFQIFDRYVLKFIAIVTMLIDHTAAAVLMNAIIKPNAPISRDSFYYQLYLLYKVMRGIGRCAFPIFCFFLVEGYKHTHDKNAYARRMLIFAFISEIPFDLAFQQKLIYTDHQNVYWTLFLGISMMITWERIGERVKGDLYLTTFLQMLSAAAFCFIAWWMKTDYDYRGLLLILIFYLFRYDRIMQTAAGALIMYWEWPAVLTAFPLLLLYNGKRGGGSKYFFYIFYPLHLILLFLLARLLYNGV